MRITLGHVLVSRVIFHGGRRLRLAFKVIPVVGTYCFDFNLNARALATIDSIIDVAYQFFL